MLLGEWTGYARPTHEPVGNLVDTTATHDFENQQESPVGNTGSPRYVTRRTTKDYPTLPPQKKAHARYPE
jgi:hypothetical protein